ncbi:MAG: single-stranded-DNA-specific exonuclease RecJ, partial [Gammaproteobacteria bacterium]|nr:single-stranded-DNA-specific exonuclease RecJ [Gammaproteobacteria bacterium]
MKKTIRRRPVPESTSLSDKFHPVLKRVLAARQIVSDADLDYSLQNLPPWQGLLGIDTAADLLCEALAAQWRIVIVADFDADGATACTVAVRALRLLGAKNIDYVVPDRFKHGYGLTPAIVEIAAARHPDLLITVDNGISSLEGVRIAKQHGMRVLITDHHLPGDILPQADAIVNPNQPGDRFPGKNFAGVGVIFYVMLALRARLRESGRFANSTMPNLAKLLDLVALGTVADVVPLDYNNRILVSQGLARIRAGECCAGIQALAKISVRDPTYVMAADLAFYLGPRLNAAGRMENMSYGIECLLNDDPRSAAEQARALDAFNQERRVVEADMQEDALEILNSLNEEASLPFGLCLFDEHWHEGVIGILASRIKERLHRPVIVLTGTQEPNEEIKGSARSVPGVHIRDVLSNLSARCPDLIGKFGGHAMAAGLSLPRGNLEEFKRAFDQEVRRSLK